MATTHLIDSDYEAWAPEHTRLLWIRPDGQGCWNYTDERGDSDCPECNNAHDEDEWERANDSQPDAWERAQAAAERAVALDVAHAPLY